jgi:LAO/AO transport system kinase
MPFRLALRRRRSLPNSNYVPRSLRSRLLFSTWVSSVSNRLDESTQQLANNLLLSTTTAVTNTLTPQQSWKQRLALSKAITLTESKLSRQQEQAAFLITHLLEHPSGTVPNQQQTSFRLGIAGAPGAGKSTFIEALGKYLLLQGGKDQGSKQPAATPLSESAAAQLWIPNTLAVLCVDPSSPRTGGSILGDKTRMDFVSQHSRAYVRPSAAAGTLGGLALATNDVVALCQIVYELVLVETVGLGQSEVEAEECVDMLVLLLPPASGDDLQGVKKGIVEACDLIVVTKADGSLLQAAKTTAGDYRGAVQYLRSVGSFGNGWERPKVMLVSSATGDGLDKVWEQICAYRHRMTEAGYLNERRQQQRKYWMWKNLQNLVVQATKDNELVREKAARLGDQLMAGTLTPRMAAAELLQSLQLIATNG